MSRKFLIAGLVIILVAMLGLVGMLKGADPEVMLKTCGTLMALTGVGYFGGNVGEHMAAAKKLLGIAELVKQDTKDGRSGGAVEKALGVGFGALKKLLL